MAYLLTLALAAAYRGAPSPQQPPPQQQPVWIGKQPDPTKPDAGLPVLGGTRKVTVYNITTPEGGNNSFGLCELGDNAGL